MRPGNPGAAADQLASIRLEDETDPVVAKIERLADLMWNSEVRRLRIRCPTVPAMWGSHVAGDGFSTPSIQVGDHVLT